MDIERYTIDASAGVKFEAAKADPRAWPEAGPLVSCKESEATFEICVDLQGHSTDRLGTSVYLVAVRRKDLGAAPTLWRVRGIPEGEFQDRIAVVVLHLRFEGGEESAQIELPVHSRGGPESLLAEAEGMQAGALPVWVGRNKRVEIRARNLSDLPLAIRAGAGPHIECDPSLWVVTEARWLGVTDGEINLAAKKQRRIASVMLRSRGWSCLRTSILPASGKDSPTTLSLSLPYVILGGVRRDAELTVQVRFLPSIWSMVVALLCGAGVASLGAVVKGASGGKLRRWVVGTVGKFIMALCVAALGILLVENESELRVFGYSLDPYQLLSLFVIGLLGGFAPFKGRQKVEEWLNALLGGSNG